MAKDIDPKLKLISNYLRISRSETLFSEMIKIK